MLRADDDILADLDAFLLACAGDEATPPEAAPASRDDGRREVLGALARRLSWCEPTGRDGRLRLVPPARGGVVAGFDLGGTKLRGALADLAGRILIEREEPTRHDGEGGARRQIGALADRLLGETGLGRESLLQVAVGVPGAVAPGGTVSLSPNLALQADEPLAAHFEDEIGVPAVVENDVNAAAYGEAWRGRGRDVASMAFLSFGTGVGAGFVLDGRLLRGAAGLAGEIAHLPVGADPFQDGASAAGGYEDRVGSAAIRAAYGSPDASVREIFDRAEAGEAGAGAAVELLARNAAIGVGAVAALIDPELVVLGGGVGSRPGLIARVDLLLRELGPFRTKVVGSGLERRAGAVGAVTLALHALRRRLAAEAGSVRGRERVG